MNRVCISGRLIKDCELRFTQNNKAVTRFTVANDVGFKENKKTYFINVVMFGSENLANYLLKGQMVNVTGTLSTGSYEAQDGTKRYTTEVIADNYGGIELVGKSKSDNQQHNDTFNDDIEPVDNGDELPF